ncbi:HD-GYP domain-containing protein [Alkalicoccus luteus]|uniref:HD domain-containing protein n=1 Tax=Alkalicoccus luteus TaxID=1237094 RepID=A0A969PRN7_9BACI|nr:HD-GYP domain-containing protein [Alkalicoccus luteus]NJP39170.1 HD domain-containing protein [Alkalicoccus luteus]
MEEMRRLFLKQATKSYLIGSSAALFCAVSLIIFHTSGLAGSELLVLFLILSVSLPIMLSAEYLSFKRHTKSLRKLVPASPSAEWQAAVRETMQYPVSSVKRVMGPHFIGISLPASALTLMAIMIDLLSFSPVYILFATAAGLLVTGLHAMIEFYLIYRPSINMAAVLNEEAPENLIGLRERSLFVTSFRQKLIISLVFTSSFPVLLLLLSFQVRRMSGTAEPMAEFWTWASLLVLITAVTAWAGAWLLYRHLLIPLSKLQEGFRMAASGEWRPVQSVFGDEFDELSNGFNAMISGIERRERRNRELLQNVFSFFAAALDARDEYTAGHSRRVASYAVSIAKEAGFSESEQDLVYKAGLLHDVGKIGVPDSILLKTGKLTETEYAAMKKHPEIGEQMLIEANLPGEWIGVLPGVRHHHERMDGTGYPDGLTGQNIPVLGRLLAVADSYDAMTSDRPYVKGISARQALRAIEEGKGRQFDPRFADAFLYVMKTSTKDKGIKLEAVE